jgi:hypothetical protein
MLPVTETTLPGSVEKLTVSSVTVSDAADAAAAPTRSARISLYIFEFLMSVNGEHGDDLQPPHPV